MTNEFIRNSIVSTQLNLNIDRIGDIKIPNVPFKEQEKIFSYLDKTGIKYDQLIQINSDKVKKLKEYRQSLISSIVTGKIRVEKNML